MENLSYQKPFVFISYASEDHAIATVFEDALNAVSVELDLGLEVFRDVHSLERGLSLTDQIMAALERTDFLLIIYTEQLKKSHSFTGAEIGAFEMSIRRDVKENKIRERRAITVYLDEMPAVEGGVLGIKLDTSALSEEDLERQARALDPGQRLAEFLRDVAYEALTRLFDLAPVEEDSKKRTRQIEEQVDIRNRKRDEIYAKIAPELVRGLAAALSSVVSSSSVEQKLLVIRWPALSTKQESGHILAGARLDAHDGTVFGLFLSDFAKTTIQYEDFKTRLLDSKYGNGAFALSALEEAVRAALRSGPVDNEQFFLATDGQLLRIIVTRHFTFYDGSRVMNMYFVPALRADVDDPQFAIASLLRVAVTFKSFFLGQESDVSASSFRRTKHDFGKVKEKIERFLRQFILVEHETHINRLDDEDRYEKIYGSKIQSDQISELFETWRGKRDYLLSVANKVRSTSIDSEDSEAVTEEWIKTLDEFTTYVEPLNSSAGTMAAQRIKVWFETGTMPEP